MIVNFILKIFLHFNCLYTYKHENIKYFCNNFIYKNYKVNYELFYKNKLWYASISSYEENIEDIIFFNAKKKKAIEQLFTYFKKIINNGSVFFYFKNYKISPNFEDVFYSIRDILVSYHFSESKNRISILKEGLVPNKNEDLCTRYASQLIDKAKPFHINFSRENSNYLWPNITNYCFGQNRKNIDLYAVKLNKIENCRIGSQGIGGCCMYYDEDESLEQQEYNKNRIIKHKTPQLYWKGCVTLKKYLKNNFFIKYIDKQYGLDEILVPYIIQKHDIILIGSWDSEGRFHETENLIQYIRPQFKNNYQKILKKYKEALY